MLKNIDLILFGRVTYEMMAAYGPAATDNDPAITTAMNNLPKLVFSRTLSRATGTIPALFRKLLPVISSR